MLTEYHSPYGTEVCDSTYNYKEMSEKDLGFMRDYIARNLKIESDDYGGFRLLLEDHEIERS